MQADRSSIISPSKATADLQASRPSWKAGRQLGHALDQQVSSLTWYQVDRLTDKCWLALGRQANQKHTLSPHFTTFHHYHHCHHWYHFHYLYHWYQSFQPRSFPLGMVCERLMEDLASTRLRVQHRSSGWSLDDLRNIPNIHSFGEGSAKLQKLYLFKEWRIESDRGWSEWKSSNSGESQWSLYFVFWFLHQCDCKPMLFAAFMHCWPGVLKCFLNTASSLPPNRSDLYSNTLISPSVPRQWSPVPEPNLKSPQLGSVLYHLSVKLGGCPCHAMSWLQERQNCSCHWIIAT